MSVMCTNYSEVDGLSQANNGAGTRFECLLKLSARSRLLSAKRKNAKILKNFLLTQMAALVVVNLSRLKLPRTAIKKDDQKS